MNCTNDCQQGRACDCDTALLSPEDMRDFLWWALIVTIACAAVAAMVWMAMSNWVFLVALLGGAYA